MIYFIVDKFTFAGSITPVESITQLSIHDEGVARTIASMRYSIKTPEAKRRTIEYYLTEVDEDLLDPRPITKRWKIINIWKK